MVESLPPEMIDLILSFLTNQQFSSAVRACKRWNKVVSERQRADRMGRKDRFGLMIFPFSRSVASSFPRKMLVIGKIEDCTDLICSFIANHPAPRLHHFLDDQQLSGNQPIEEDDACIFMIRSTFMSPKSMMLVRKVGRSITITEDLTCSLWNSVPFDIVLLQWNVNQIFYWKEGFNRIWLKKCLPDVPHEERVRLIESMRDERLNIIVEPLARRLMYCNY